MCSRLWMPLSVMPALQYALHAKSENLLIDDGQVKAVETSSALLRPTMLFSRPAVFPTRKPVAPAMAMPGPGPADIAW